MGSSRAATIVLALAATLIVTAPACRAPVKPYECLTDIEGVTPDPQGIWRCHRDIMRRVSKNKQFSLREFREASAFFSRVTSIEPNVIESAVGPVPDRRDVKQHLALWDTWYEVNAHRLYWDAGSEAVEVRD
ncbi:MAG: hypothetical protein GY716_16445 [bacterium]|nr:hypothetical protein [bacterium]